MPNSQFHTAISQPRFSKYLSACGNNKRKALELYRANILLSQKMYAVIGVFEVILRNSIDRHFVFRKGNNWLEDAVQPGGYLDIAPGCEDAYHSIQEGIYKLGFNYTHDRLIAKLSFGFWTYQFAAKEYAAAGSTLLDIFPNRPFGTKQKIIFQNLIKINDIRNRIAHYEPICFDKTTGNISTTYTEKRYNLIVELLYWLGCNPKKILYGIDCVQKTIKMVREKEPINLSVINSLTQRPG
jgi:hypothetical protein